MFLGCPKLHEQSINCPHTLFAIFGDARFFLHRSRISVEGSMLVEEAQVHCVARDTAKPKENKDVMNGTEYHAPRTMRQRRIAHRATNGPVSVCDSYFTLEKYQRLACFSTEDAM